MLVRGKFQEAIIAEGQAVPDRSLTRAVALVLNPVGAAWAIWANLSK